MLNLLREPPWPLLAAIVIWAALLPQRTAHAQASIPGYPDQVQAYDAREVAMLPRYCLVTTGFRTAGVPGSDNPPAFKHWESVFGVEMFKAMHHYCWGLMKTNRAMLLSRNKVTREWYLNSALSEFDYILNNVNKHAGSKFVLLPEILTKKGENLIRLGKGAVAIRELEAAMALKPDYWPPYLALGDYYREAGDIAKAREVLEKGLVHSPESKSLKMRLADLESAKGRRAPAAKPANAKSGDAKPTEAKPEDPKPADAKPPAKE